ncbi:MAG: RagB/SusD family nutrient uptake outer membrane protein [Chitinophagaceae bacterium]|nr:RagB/SusD family nutrient uptake outer membrane protein [Chitinophagaceae bacterium]
MKKVNKKIVLLFVILMTFTLISCKKDFLDVPPKGTTLTENFYKTRNDAYAALVATYDVVRKNTGGFENMVSMMNAGSDDNVAGGASPTDGAGIHAFDNFTLTPTVMPGSYWNDYYQGIFRANILLSKIDAIPMDAAEKARFIGETKALRAHYYFNLVRMFKNIPLILEVLTPSTMYEVTQANPTDVYTRIEKDLTDAVAALPITVPTSELGRWSKGSAQALLGKVYLYQNKNSLAAAQFLEVNGTPGSTSIYGYRLLSNYSDLWSFTNKFNTESVIECTHSNQSKNDWGFWGSGADEGNTFNVMVGIRGYTRRSGTAAPAAMPGGWSFSTFTQSFYDAIKTDPRFGATVLDLKAFETAGEISYTHGDDDLGYYLNKFMPRPENNTTLGGAQELNYTQNSYIIRLADTYLMEAEALGGVGTRAQALLDAVRARVGLPSVPVSLAAIKAERRLELGGEGHRFFDLVRWGEAASKLSSKGFVAGKNEIFPIPFRELQGTKLVQNPGYN